MTGLLTSFRYSAVRLRIAGGLLLLGMALSAQTQARAATDGIAVVASIPPLQALTAAIMGGEATASGAMPKLLVPPGANPHALALKPSQARMLQQADVIVRIGPALEGWLDKPLATLAGGAIVITMQDASGMTLRRMGERDDAHDDHDDSDDHDEHTDSDEHDDHDEHAEHDDHDMQETGDAHDHGHDHAAGGLDPHLWLDPENATALAPVIAAALGRADPARAETYRQNARRLVAQLRTLTQEMRDIVRPVAHRPFIAGHDALGYFSARFDLDDRGAVTPDPDLRPGARRLREVAQQMKEQGIICLFTDTTIPPDSMAVLTEGSGARVARLDFLGQAMPDSGGLDGAAVYARLMRDLATGIRDCLSP